MVNTIFAYVLVFFVVGGLGALAGTLLATPLIMIAAKIGSKFITFIICTGAGFLSGWLAVYLGVKLFQWLGVEFGFLSLLAVYVPILSNDLKRAQGGVFHEVAILLGTACSFIFFSFLVLTH